jgi:ubiquinone/menaquinone biosynthesis C-methylase UbiE
MPDQEDRTMIDPKASAGPLQANHGSLYERIMGYWSTCLVYAAARLGLADLLAPGPQTSAALAVATGTDPQRLHRVLRGLVAINVLAEDADGHFSLTAMGAELRSDVPGSLRALAIFQCECAMSAWRQIPDVLRTGRSGFELAFGAGLYEHMARQPADDVIWNQAMVDSARAWLEDGGLLSRFEWRAGQTVIDVGGGHGPLLAGLLAQHRELRGVVFDLPRVVAGAGPYLEAAGVADRCQAVGGDATKAVPEGGDVYLFTRVLFNWDDDVATTMLASCARVMHPDARLLVIDIMVADGPAPDPATLIDLNNLMLFGGRARTEAQWRCVFANAGLVLDRATRVAPMWALLEGRRKEGAEAISSRAVPDSVSSGSPDP